MIKKILVIAAHPDDEILGCGGTIAKHVSQRDEVSILTMTDGVSSRGEAKTEIESRESALAESCKILGANYFCFDFPDNKMDSIPLLDIVKKIEEKISETKPSLIYTHFYNDLNVDHRRVHDAVMTACRPQPGFSVKEIRLFEVVSSTHWNNGRNFSPNLYIDIEKHIETKRQCLEKYQEEMRSWPHQRSFEAIEALEKFRGSSVGVKRAEAFMAIRKLE